MVIARFRHGHVEKGTTRDFSHTRPTFHLFPGGDESTPPLEIRLESLKALFFVKSFDGNSERRDDYDFDAVRDQGRRVRVTFEDGESVEGFTMGYSKSKPGFFVIPADPGGNNLRVFVVASAVKNVEFLPADSSLGAA